MPPKRNKLTEEEKRENKRLKEAARRNKKKQQTEVQRNNAAVLYIVGDSDFGRVKFDPSNPIYTSTNDDHNIQALLDWMFASVKNRNDVLKLMLSLDLFSPDAPPISISDVNLATLLDQAASSPNAPSPLVGLVDPNPGVQLSRETLNHHIFDIQHQTMISGFLLSQDGGKPYFTTQSTIIKHGANAKVVEWISRNFDVVYDGHDFSPYESNSLAEYLALGEPATYQVPSSIPNIPTVDYYLGILGRISHIAGTALYPPNSLNYLFCMKDRRDRLYKDYMLPNIHCNIPFDLPATADNPEMGWDHISWEQVARFLWMKLYDAYQNVDTAFITSPDFTETTGMVIKPTSYACAAQGIAFLTPVKTSGRRGESTTVLVKNVHGEEYLSPQAWYESLTNSQKTFRIEPLVHELRDNEYRFFFSYTNGILQKQSCCRTKYNPDGTMTKFEHVGFYSDVEFEPNYYLENGEVDQAIHANAMLFHRKITGFPEKFVKSVLTVAEEEKAVFFMEGLVYRLDMCRYVKDNRVYQFVNEVTLCPPGDAFCYYGNSHWFVANNFHNSFVHFMTKWWRKWPN